MSSLCKKVKEYSWVRSVGSHRGIFNMYSGHLNTGMVGRAWLILMFKFMTDCGISRKKVWVEWSMVRVVFVRSFIKKT